MPADLVSVDPDVAARLGELRRVVQQVGKDLREACDIPVNGDALTKRAAVESVTAALDVRTGHLDGQIDCGSKIDAPASPCLMQIKIAKSYERHAYLYMDPIVLLLQRAAEVAGSEAALAKSMQVVPELLAKWISGDGGPSHSAFLVAAELVARRRPAPPALDQ